MKTTITSLILMLLFISSTNAQSCVADFEYSFNSYNPAGVQFINKSTGNNLNYQWNMGDGSTYNYQSFTYNFRENKSYQVCLTIQSATDTSCYAKICKTIQIQNYNKCKAMYYFERDSINPLKIRFFQNAVGDSLSYLWAFGDGTFSQETNPIKTYSQKGNYSICLTVQRPSTGGISSFCNTFPIDTFVNNCDANFTYINFSDKVWHFEFPFHGINYNRCVYDWEMGDGTNKKGRLTSHQFQDAGNYLVCLTVMDSIDRTFNNKSCRVFMITPINAANKCTAKFSYLKKGSPLTNYFTPYSNYDDSEAKYLWTFGDGDTSSSKNPSHTYKENGNYTICLNVQSINDTCNLSYCETHSFVDSTVGIESYFQEGAFSIYPNPVKDKIRIKQNLDFDIGNLELMLTDQSGRILLEKKIPIQRKEDEIELDFSELGNGIYFVHLNSAKGNAHLKILKSE